MSLISLDYRVYPADDFSNEFFIGQFFHDLICIVAGKNGIKLAVHNDIPDLRKIFRDDLGYLIVIFEIHYLAVSNSLLALTYKFFALIKIVWKAS